MCPLDSLSCYETTFVTFVPSQVPSNWYPSEAVSKELVWQEHPNGAFATAVLECDPDAKPLSTALLERIRKHFQMGGPRGQPQTKYDIVSIQLVRNPTLARNFADSCVTLERRIAAHPNVFAKAFPDDGVKHMLMKRLKQHFLPTATKHVHVMPVWHGTAAAQSICTHGAADLRRVDGGFFGAGIYSTPHAEYACTYCSPNTAGDRTVLLQLVLTGNTYPISRQTDYEHPDKIIGGSVSCFHFQHPVPYDPETGKFDTRTANLHKSDKGMKAGFDSHFVSVSKKMQYQATDSAVGYDYDEIVVKEAAQVLPLAIVKFKAKLSIGDVE